MAHGNRKRGLGLAPGRCVISFLGDSRIFCRRQRPVEQVAESSRRGGAHKGSSSRAFCGGSARARAERLCGGGFAHPRKCANFPKFGRQTSGCRLVERTGVIARDRGDLAPAHSLFEENILLWRELGDQKAVARSLSNLANVLKLQGDFARARSLYEECLLIFSGLEDKSGVAWSFNYQGDVACDQGDFGAAQNFYEKGLSIFREIGDRRGIAGALADLGNLAVAQNNYAAAHTLYRESLKIFQELEQKRGVARVLECFACLAATQSHAERSLRLAGTAAALRKNIGSPLTPAEQAKLESTLQAARQSLTNAAGATAWLEGWAMPAEKSVEAALMNEAAAALD